ncbi:asparaginase [Larsenimonas salina]|uniref:asparaginase n=1 Tax=Larsenimonas salina TaxID=1295565 RepID=UPI00207386A0|nr:asparaginase [Larsenimonas salina]MCM5703042.1 asparaginase [Larsenimonas salina]
MTGSVHILYTGGTIGMREGPNGLAPADGLDRLAQNHQAQSTWATPLPAWSFHALAPLIDSANMTPTHWRRVIEAVRASARAGASGVVVLHGTDTLAYSAAALSFWLKDIDLPVIITGSMWPAGVEGGDAWPNFFGSLQALERAPNGVSLFFHETLMPATRTRKVKSHGWQAFQAVPYADDQVKAQARTQVPVTCELPETMPKVGVFPLYPGVDPALLESMLDTGLDAVVLECFGSGTGPSENGAFMAALKRAHAEGVLVVAISQCAQGGVALATYEAGQVLQDVGVLSGGDMTREAAYAKLHFVLAQRNLSAFEQAELIDMNVCGERSI